MPIWEIQLFISGPVTVKERLMLNEPKGFRLENQFYSDINLRSTPLGVSATVTARAETSQLARKAALFFFGQMLDVLAIQVNQPLYISLHERQSSRAEAHHVRRIIEIDEWHQSFTEARSLSSSEPSFLVALGWHRKGLYTEDPFDKFLAFWNSIERVATKYHPKNNEAAKGSKSQIWECFKLLWGDCEQWPIIKGDRTWIDDNYETRKNIAHGLVPIDITKVELVLQKLDTIQQVAYHFLSDWKEQYINQSNFRIINEGVVLKGSTS